MTPASPRFPAIGGCAGVANPQIPQYMRLKVIIVGSNGRIGGAVASRFAASADFSVVALDRAALPLDDPAAVAERLKQHDFDVLVNTAAITSVDACEEDPSAAWRVNAEAPAVMAGVCRDIGARMIHLSTDYVFDGVLPGMRTEEEVARPMGHYGKSKLGGEVRVLQAAPANLVLRTSWVFGSRRPSFPDMILGRARQGLVIKAIADKWSCPCYNEDFARWLESLVRRPDLGGIIHLCNSGECTWQEYAQAVLDIAADFGMESPHPRVEPIALKEMPHFLAPRPIHSSMSSARFTKLTGHTPRPWQDALRAYLQTQLSRP